MWPSLFRTIKEQTYTMYWYIKMHWLPLLHKVKAPGPKCCKNSYHVTYKSLLKAAGLREYQKCHIKFMKGLDTGTAISWCQQHSYN